MNTIGLFFGSSTGNTKDAATSIKARLNACCDARVDLLDIGSVKAGALLNYDRLILGIPTWNIGQWQLDWENREDDLRTLDLSGKTVALFGVGDQHGYPDTFQDAMGMLADAVRSRGAALIGAWPADGYHISRSKAVQGKHFVGLALDYDNEWTQTDDRIAAWVDQLIGEFGLERRIAREGI